MAELFNLNFQTIGKALDSTVLRNKVIAQNIANAETPGYKKREVAFEDVFNQVLEDDIIRLRRTDARHISNIPDSLSQVQPKVVQINSTSVTNDQNNVDIDEEMALLAMNTERYQVLARLMDQNIARYNIILRGVK